MRYNTLSYKTELWDMGYNTWNFYQCNINEKVLTTTANLMKSLGLLDAGYNYVNIDDCYALKKRNAAGLIVEDPAKFPSGMANLTSYLHSHGFKAGIYSDSGWMTCGGYPGSYDNELLDAQTFHKWGFDYLKYDNCAIPYDSITRENTPGRYRRMSDAIASVAKSTKSTPMVFSLCEWGWQQVWLWGKEFGQSWRTTGDIGPYWESLTNIINFNSFIASSTDYYGRNDLDMLQIGNGNLTYHEARSHWTVWALMKSPLFIGTNLSAITKETLEILTNREIIAINQDPVIADSITPFRWGLNPDWTSNSTHPAQYWSGRTQNGTVVMMLNTLNKQATMSFNLTETPWLRSGRQYSVRDLWAHTNNGTAVRKISAQVPPHGVVALLLKDAGDEPAGLNPPCAVWWQCTDKNGTHVGG
ncbi:glycoside hydrolase family 27 protein [Botryobasidium botryosum FD-172 SS1]|uniref:Alpha-galactosidase n=1 Tax=Botryobasidium botryosum (strain FD-172 SS1) TaxID=930990 RepID=A0A067MBQ1_BOTB1|nr:glycoside hydrolase family 27 protein [Botryobasidium botryosum FD-172 SS1]